MLKNFGSKITVQRTDRVALLVHSVNNPGNLVVSIAPLDGPPAPATILFNHHFPPPNPAAVPIQNPPAPPAPGIYNLSWSFIPTGKPWQITTEIQVNGVIVFQRPQSDANSMFGGGFVRLEVI